MSRQILGPRREISDREFQILAVRFQILAAEFQIFPAEFENLVAKFENLHRQLLVVARVFQNLARHPAEFELPGANSRPAPTMPPCLLDAAIGAPVSLSRIGETVNFS